MELLLLMDIYCHWIQNSELADSGLSVSTLEMLPYGLLTCCFLFGLLFVFSHKQTFIEKLTPT